MANNFLLVPADETQSTQTRRFTQEVALILNGLILSGAVVNSGGTGGGTWATTITQAQLIVLLDNLGGITGYF